MLITLLAASAFVQDAPKGPPLADADALCFVAGTMTVRDMEAAGENITKANSETAFFAATILGRYDDAALIGVMDKAKTAATGRTTAAAYAGCHDRYQRALDRLRVANTKSN